MFTIIYHEDAATEFHALPSIIRAKMAKLIGKLEDRANLLREPDSKPMGNGLFEIRTQGTDIARGLYVFQKGREIFLLSFFVKKSMKTPKAEINMAFKRLEEMING